MNQAKRFHGHEPGLDIGLQVNRIIQHRTPETNNQIPTLPKNQGQDSLIFGIDKLEIVESPGSSFFSLSFHVFDEILMSFIINRNCYPKGICPLRKPGQVKRYAVVITLDFFRENHPDLSRS